MSDIPKHTAQRRAVPKLRGGWAKPDSAKMFHFFADGKALCGAGGYQGELWPDNGAGHPEDCPNCRRAFNKRNEGGQSWPMK